MSNKKAQLNNNENEEIDKKEYQQLKASNSYVKQEVIHESPKNLESQKSPQLNENKPGQASFFYSDPHSFQDDQFKFHPDMASLTIENAHLNKKGDHAIVAPQFICLVGLNVSSNLIMDIFFRMAKEQDYTTIENEKQQALIIRKNKITFKDYLMNCLLKKEMDKHISAIKLKIQTNKLKCKRKISLICLKGDNESSKKFIDQFRNELETKTKKKFSEEMEIDHPEQPSNLQVPDKQFALIKEQDEDAEFDHTDSQNNPFALESTANFMFFKILSAQAYGVGKKVADYVQDFQTNYRSIEESADLLPQPINSIVILINEVVDNVFSEFNYGKSETKTVMPFCRISIEKYIFSKLYDQVMAMYIHKYKQKEEKFINKRQKIYQQQSIVDMLSYLDLTKKFWLINNEEEFKSLDRAGKKIPYHLALFELDKINSVFSPREKLKSIMMMRSLMRAEVIDFYKGKEELVSMDDELPVNIYIVLMSNIQNIFAEFAFVEDFINLDPTIESEKRLITNLRVSCHYIADEWKVNE